jgi:hypothetical protein
MTPSADVGDFLVLSAKIDIRAVDRQARRRIDRPVVETGESGSALTT